MGGAGIAGRDALEAVSSLLTWRWDLAAVPQRRDYSFVAVELDLTSAVTMMVTMAADMPPRREEGQVFHEGALFWQIEDTIDGEDWYQVIESSLGPRSSKQVRRISSPLGLRARLGIRAVVGTGSTHLREWKLCQNTECSFDHAALCVTRARCSVAVRTI